MQAAPGTYTHGHVSVGMGQTRSGLSGHNCANECLMKEGPDEFDWAAVALGTLRLLTCYTNRARFCVPRMYCIRTAGGRATTLAGRGGAGVRRGRIQYDVWIPEMRLAFWVNFESVSMVDRPAAPSPRKGVCRTRPRLLHGVQGQRPRVYDYNGASQADEGRR